MKTEIGNVLKADHAVLVNITGGSKAEHTLLVVGGNSHDGYQSATDIVIDITGISGSLAITDFVI